MIEHILALCTSHLQQSTVTQFEQLAYCPGDLPEDNKLSFRLSSHNYGFTLFIVSEPDEDEEHEIETYGWSELKDIFALARFNKVSMIHFDTDADVHPRLKNYEW